MAKGLREFQAIQTPLRDSAPEVVGPILKKSARRRSEALETVEALYAEGLSRKRAAARPGIDPNTLAYRLERLTAFRHLGQHWLVGVAGGCSYGVTPRY